MNWGREDKGSRMIQLIYCKNLCKCHNVPPLSPIIKEKKPKRNKKKTLISIIETDIACFTFSTMMNTFLIFFYLTLISAVRKELCNPLNFLMSQNRYHMSPWHTINDLELKHKPISI
jgi:hypothetical protein